MHVEVDFILSSRFGHSQSACTL